jgi:hypothetical protein
MDKLSSGGPLAETNKTRGRQVAHLLAFVVTEWGDVAGAELKKSEPYTRILSTAEKMGAVVLTRLNDPNYAKIVRDLHTRVESDWKFIMKWVDECWPKGCSTVINHHYIRSRHITFHVDRPAAEGHL